jgi:NADPH:quinone reductase-like Zn-dependent oxidoreductase
MIDACVPWVPLVGHPRLTACRESKQPPQGFLNWPLTKDRAWLRPGETLLVLGAAGGVGLAAVELGKLLGVHVIAAASGDEKLEIAHRHGAATINYATEDLGARVRALSASGSVDVVYDPVGGDYAEPALRTVSWGGRYLVVGVAAGQIPKIPLNLALLKGGSLVGVFWGEFTRREPERNTENVQQLFAWLKDKQEETALDSARRASAAAKPRAGPERRSAENLRSLVSGNEGGRTSSARGRPHRGLSPQNDALPWYWQSDSWLAHLHAQRSCSSC